MVEVLRNLTKFLEGLGSNGLVRSFRDSGCSKSPVRNSCKELVVIWFGQICGTFNRGPRDGASMEQVNPGDLQVPDGEWASMDLEEINQTEVHMASGKVHRVLYAIRHPERDWAYANRVTGVTEEGDIESNDMVMQTAQIESIESDQVSTSNGEHVSDRYWLLYYSCSYESTEFDEIWKATANIQEQQ